MSAEVASSGVAEPVTASRGVIARNPNASVALGSGAGIGAVIVWLVGLAGVTLPAEVGAVIGGVTAAVFLWIGRRGVKGAGASLSLWIGSGAGRHIGQSILTFGEEQRIKDELGT
jgi:hypothetical protein